MSLEFKEWCSGTIELVLSGYKDELQKRGWSWEVVDFGFPSSEAQFWVRGLRLTCETHGLLAVLPVDFGELAGEHLVQFRRLRRKKEVLNAAEYEELEGLFWSGFDVEPEVAWAVLKEEIQAAVQGVVRGWLEGWRGKRALRTQLMYLKGMAPELSVTLKGSNDWSRWTLSLKTSEVIRITVAFWSMRAVEIGVNGRTGGVIGGVGSSIAGTFTLEEVVARIREYVGSLSAQSIRSELLC